jgi:rare lipoprotein A
MYKATFSFIFLFIFLLLGGCKTMNGEMNEASADPSSDASHYRVRGKTYHVMKTGKNYQAQGKASWYGAKFHKKRTSSGERYNMYKYTAAHRTLPLSTYVLVTNLVNGRQVVVKVNDRGPFVSNRLIDLSYAAAKKIGMVGMGTAKVDVKAIDTPVG